MSINIEIFCLKTIFFIIVDLLAFVNVYFWFILPNVFIFSLKTQNGFIPFSLKLNPLFIHNRSTRFFHFERKRKLLPCIKIFNGKWWPYIHPTTTTNLITKTNSNNQHLFHYIWWSQCFTKLVLLHLIFGFWFYQNTVDNN